MRIDDNRNVKMEKKTFLPLSKYIRHKIQVIPINIFRIEKKEEIILQEKTTTATSGIKLA